MNAFRILVTGSRDWPDTAFVYQALAHAVREVPADRKVTVVHGACPTGADAMAHRCVCLAFISACSRRDCRYPDPHGSHGATHCAGLAHAAGIPVRRWTA